MERKPLDKTALTAEQVRNEIRHQRAVEAEGIAQYNMLAEILAPFLAKPMGERFKKSVKEQIAGHGLTLSFQWSARMFYAVIIGADGVERRFLLGREPYGATTLPKYSAMEFKESNACYGTAGEARNQERDRVLSSTEPEELAELVRNASKAVAELEEWRKNNPCFPEFHRFDIDK